MKKLFSVILAVVFVGVVYAQPSLVSTKVNGFNVLSSAYNDTTATNNTVYSAKFSGAGINGRKIVVGFQVIDTATVGTTATAPTVDVDLQGSFDGTNFFNVAAAAVNDDRFYGSTWAVPGAGTVDLTAYNLPWYRLALVPSGSLGNASTTTSVTCGEFKWKVAGLP